VDRLARPRLRRPRFAPAAIAALLLALALGLRVAEVQRTGYVPLNDGASYLKLAREIAHGGSYAHSDPGAGGSRGPSAYFPPGFPYFLAGVHVISPGVGAARIAQSVLGTAAVGLIGLVALELFGTTAALVAIAIGAVYPVLIELSGVLVAENLLVVIVLAAVWAVLRARRGRPTRWALAAGVLVGLATLTHQNAIVVLIPCLFALWGGKRPWLRPALLVAAAAVTIAPWTIRNAVVLHRFVPVSDESGITLVGTYNPISASNTRIPYGWRLYLPRFARSRVSEPELASRLLSSAARYVRAHPLAPLKAAFHNTLRLLELEGSFAWRSSAASIGLSRSTAEVGVISFWILLMLALGGICTTAWRAVPKWVWFVPVLLALSVVLVNAETPRFREPLEPFLILPAACAVLALAGRLRRTPIGGEARPILTA
jgi:4-amino-4-deoxy-L-arabinose transferase-like glycosyltransferase